MASGKGKREQQASKYSFMPRKDKTSSLTSDPRKRALIVLVPYQLIVKLGNNEQLGPTKFVHYNRGSL